MKNVLIIEHNTNSLKPINESVNGQKDKYTMGGVFTEFDVKNRNERVYTWDKFKPAFGEFNERIDTLGTVYGEWDHPSGFDLSLKNVSHLIESAQYNESSNCIEGKIRLVNTRYGKEAKALVDEGFPLFVSSRAAGVTEANGEVTLKKLFTYDMVADPGFSSAKMETLNESLGFDNPKSNFQIYEMKDESKINQLFEMNKNDLVTKKQMVEYSEYLVDTIRQTKRKIDTSIKEGKLQPKKIEELSEYYESMMEEQSKIAKYLDYLAENLRIVVKENETLKESNSKLEKTTDNLIKHNDYLAENLEKSIKYGEYIAENVDKAIQYGEYIAENLDKTIEHNDYLAENLNKSIEYSEYIAENVDNNIAFSEYIAENLDTNIAYSEYLAENLDDGIAYTDYIAENLDKSINYSKVISEKLNSKVAGKIFENTEDEDEELIPSLDTVGISEIEADEVEVNIDTEVEGEEDEDENGEEANCRVVCDDEESIENTPDLEGDEDETEEGEIEGDEDTEEDELEAELEKSVEESADTECKDCDEDKDKDKDKDEMEIESEEDLDIDANELEDELKESDLSKSIDELIAEAKKREASKTKDPHFMKFLNKKQIDAFYSMENDTQEDVVAYINEKGNYYSQADVLKLMNEALRNQEESLEDRLVKFMPDDVKDTWSKISESAKVSILSQAKLHPNAKWNEDTIEHFWSTRKFPVIKESNRELIKEDKLILEDTLSDDAINSIMERFNRV